MRKVLPFLLVIALAMPALADVAVTVSDATGGVAKVDLTISGAVVRGVAIKVTVTGADLADVADVTDVMADFNTYIDYYYSNSGFLGAMVDENDLPGDGAHCVANPDAAGVLTALPATVFSISLGALDNTGGQGGVTASGTLCKIKLSNFAGSSASVCVEADALRGGIVGDSLGTVSYGACASIAAPGPSECFNNNLGHYAAWVQFGKPDCWCYRYNCRGDANNAQEGNALGGFYWVGQNDLSRVIAAWQIKEPPKGPGIATIPNGICADFARDQEGNALGGFYRVGQNDLNILIASWQIKEAPKGPGISICPLAPTGGEINFYKP